MYVVRRPAMAHSQNWFGLLTPNIATILPWSESPQINPWLQSNFVPVRS